MDLKHKGSTVCDASNISTREMGPSWQRIRRDTWQRGRLNDRPEMMMKAIRWNYRMQRIQEYKTGMMMMNRKKILLCGDADTTIWRGVCGVGAEALDWQRHRPRLEEIERDEAEGLR